jgi:pimeloyl-ACP methyl ester carboxylesterase
MTTTSTAPTSRTGYDDLGAGDPALLLLPGWCGDRFVFDHMATALAAHRRVLVSDLGGHGGNAGHTGDFDSRQQVNDLLALVDELGVDRIVPVTLSHAGWFGIELRRRLGAERVPGLVLMDWMVLGTPPGFTDALAGLQDPAAWQEVRGALFGMWTQGVGATAVHDYVASMAEYGFEHWSRAGREIAASFAAEGSPLDALARLDQPCPTLHLYAQPTDDGYLVAQQQAAAQHTWFSVQRLTACSHFPMLEAPGAAAAQVERFVTNLV